jgi:predicted RNase H-like HicB family nuclease
MPEPIDLEVAVIYERVEDGWVMASVPAVPGVISQGRSRSEARDNVRDALQEVLAYRASERRAEPETDPLRLTIGP